MAWLNAVPNAGAKDPNKKTRRELLTKDGRLDKLSMPPIKNGHYLLELFLSTGMRSGDGPLSWADLQAFTSMCTKGLTAWEVETIRSLSVTYIGVSSQAKKPNYEAPYLTDKTATLELMRVNVVKQLDNFFDKHDNS